MQIFKFTIVFLSLLILIGCQRRQEPASTKHMPAPTLGVYDSAYDKAKWAWIDNDGQELLKNKTIPDCYLGYNTELLGYEMPGFRVSRKVKVFRGVKYDVFTITENDQLWCITYSKQNSKLSQLSVYAVTVGGKCQEEAESLISLYEKSIMTK